MKKQLFFGLVSATVAAAFLYLGGCGGGLKGTGDKDCGNGDECSGSVCVALIDGNNPPNYCTQTCSASAACPSGFYCDNETFGIAGLSFCRFGGTKPEQPAPPSEAPRFICKADADCAVAAGDGQVCATFEGERECSIVCTQESQCTFSFGGVTFSFLTCASDTTPGTSRKVCLPKKSCYTDPQSCITVSGFGG
jgi:hypothetical protein